MTGSANKVQWETNIVGRQKSAMHIRNEQVSDVTQRKRHTKTRMKEWGVAIWLSRYAEGRSLLAHECLVYWSAEE